MADEFVYESGEPVGVGSHGSHDYLFAAGNEVIDNGESAYVFESGTGLSRSNVLESFENFPNDKGLYSGDTGVFGSTDSVQTHGDRSGYIEDSPGQDFVYTNSKDSTQSDEVYRVDVRADGGSNTGVLFFTQNDGAAYSVEITPAQSGEFEINLLQSDGSRSVIVSQDGVASADTWYTLEFQKQGHSSIEATLVEEGVTISDNDALHSSGGFGFKSGGVGSGKARFDYLRRVS